MRRFVALTVPALGLTILAPVITIPDTKYETGWLSSIGLLCVLIGTVVAGLDPGRVQLEPRSREPAAGRRTPSLASTRRRAPRRRELLARPRRCGGLCCDRCPGDRPRPRETCASE